MVVPAETWTRLLNRTGARLSLAVVMPVPLHASASRAGEHLRNAIRKLNNGEYEDAVVSARKAVEAIPGDWPSYADIKLIASKNRSYRERLAALRHDLFSLASLAHHEDYLASSATWDRESALAVVAAVAALAAAVAD